MAKTILALERGVIPPNANFELLNQHIDADFFHLKFPTECVPWPTSDEIRRASVNSFGFGGSNAHAVLEAADHFLMTLGYSELPSLSLLSAKQNTPAHICGHSNRNVRFITNEGNDLKDSFHSSSGSPVDANNDLLDRVPRPRLIILSASDEDGIARLAQLLSKLGTLSRQDCYDDVILDDITFTLNMRRSMLEWKSHVVLETLSSFQSLQESLSKPTKQPLAARRSLGFVFTGQGAQWPRMGHDLIGWPVFKESLMRSQLYLDAMGCNWSLMGKWTPGCRYLQICSLTGFWRRR